MSTVIDTRTEAKVDAALRHIDEIDRARRKALHELSGATMRLAAELAGCPPVLLESAVLITTWVGPYLRSSDRITVTVYQRDAQYWGEGSSPIAGAWRGHFVVSDEYQDPFRLGVYELTSGAEYRHFGGNKGGGYQCSPRLSLPTGDRVGMDLPTLTGWELYAEFGGGR